MRLVTFERHKEQRVGAEFCGKVLDLNAACKAMLEAEGDSAAQTLADGLVPPDMIHFLSGGQRCLDQANKVLDFASHCTATTLAQLAFKSSEIRVLAPVPRPGKVVCVGRNYHDHVSEMKRDVPTIPVIFSKLHNTIIANGEDVPFPRVSEQLDYEAELVVVIGKKGRYIAEERAMDHVAGYSAFNDITVRDWQHRANQWLQGKSFDGTGPTGPVLVTADEIPHPDNLDLKLWLNGALRQSDNTSRLIFKIPYLISFVSQVMTLEPGDMIATGTPGGVGVAMDPKGFMKVGDVVRVEIEGIGTLENTIVEG